MDIQLPQRPIEPEAADLTIAELMDLYLNHCRRRYTKFGRQTTSYDRVRFVLGLAIAAGLGPIPLSHFGPIALDAFRVWLARHPSQRWSRSTISIYAQLLVGMIKFANAQQITTPAHVASFASMEPLRRGRSLTDDGVVLRDSQPVNPVSDEDLERVLPHCRQPIDDMIRLQQLAAMRPGEIVSLRRRDLRPSPRPGCLEYVVREDVNKMSHHDRERVVILGPRAVQIVNRWAEGKKQGYIFDPRQALEIERARRKKISIGHAADPDQLAARARQARIDGVPPRRVGDRYTVASYRRAIERACARAGITPFSPNQIRHTACTEVASSVGVAIAQQILGHADIRTTMRYVGSLRREATAYMSTHG
jgi:integrase